MSTFGRDLTGSEEATHAQRNQSHAISSPGFGLFGGLGALQPSPSSVVGFGSFFGSSSSSRTVPSDFTNFANPLSSTGWGSGSGSSSDFSGSMGYSSCSGGPFPNSRATDFSGGLFRSSNIGSSSGYGPSSCSSSGGGLFYQSTGFSSLSSGFGPTSSRLSRNLDNTPYGVLHFLK